MDYFVIVWYGTIPNQRPEIWKTGTYQECKEEKTWLIRSGVFHMQNISVYSERTIPEHLNYLLPDKYFK